MSSSSAPLGPLRPPLQNTQDRVGGPYTSPAPGSPSSPTSPASPAAPPAQGETDQDVPAQKVLSFAPAAPGSANVATNAASALGRSKIPSASLRAHRAISSRPEKVLDAADISDDFYHHLIDWSVLNQVVIVLRQAVYIWDCDAATVELLVDMATQPEKLGGGEYGLVTAARWHPGGGCVVVGTASGAAQVWDVEAKKRLRTLKIPPPCLAPAVAAPPADAEQGSDAPAEDSAGPPLPQVGAMDWADASTLTIGYGTGWIVDHDIRLPDSAVRMLPAHAGLVCGLMYRPDGALFASGGNDNVLSVWDRVSSQPVMTRTEHKAAIKALSWSPFNPHILASGGGSACRTVNIWNVQTKTRLMSWATESQISSLHWSWYHRELLTTHGAHPTDPSATGAICFWSYPSRKLLYRIDRAHEGRILDAVLSPDGQKLASVDTGANELRFWTVFQAEGKGGGTSRPKRA